jgi:anti-sigma B factor antagonist
VALEYIDSDIGDVTVISFTGRITLGEGTAKLRQAVEDVLARGRRKILLDFKEVFYVDSTGLGTLLHEHTQVQNQGGSLKLMRLKEITRDLLQITKLYTVFEVYPDEPSALASFRQTKPRDRPSQAISKT